MTNNFIEEVSLSKEQEEKEEAERLEQKRQESFLRFMAGLETED